MGFIDPLIDGGIFQKKNESTACVFIVAEPSYFVSHRLELARKARDRGGA